MHGRNSEKYLRVDYLDVGQGHHLYYEERGNPDGAPLLLVHGGSGFTLDMDRFIAVHGSDRRIIVMHQRGVGKSTPAGRYHHNSVQDNIDDIERLRSHLGLEKMDVFSWSFGTVFAAGYVMEYPDRVRSLTAYSPYLGSEEDYAVLSQKQPDMAEAYFSLHGSRQGKGIVTSVFNKAAAKDWKTRFHSYWMALQLTMDNPPDEQELYRSKTPEQWETFFDIRLIGAQHDMELFGGKDRFLEKLAEAKKPDIPVTLIYGSEDNWSAPNIYARRVFPNAKVIMVPGAGHDVHDKRVQARLVKLLRRVGAPIVRKASFRAGSALRP